MVVSESSAPGSVGLVRSGGSVGSVVLLGNGAFTSMFLADKEFLNVPDDLHKAVDLRHGVVEIKAGPGGGFDAELFHERLIAMMPAPQRDSALIGHRHDIMGMDAIEEKTHQASA